MRQKAPRINRSARRVAAFPPAFARVVRFEASIARLDHSHCIQPQAPTWGIKYSATEALPSWPRSPCFAAPGLGGPSWRSAAYAAGVGCAFMGCPAAKAAEAESHARCGEAGLSQRRRDARDWSSRVTCSSRSRRSSSPAPNARPRRCRRSSAAPETISFTRSPSCIGTGASCMSRWRLGPGKSLRARPVSRTKLTNPTSRTNLTRPTSRPPRIDFGGNQG